ncbi:MAG: MerR family transcriptional regulator [Nitrospinota bacterium]|nr:MAG: MerR family transcriptional regulator [Nitrospinota bacterium]
MYTRQKRLVATANQQGLFPAGQVVKLTGISRQTLHFWSATGFLQATQEAQGTGKWRLYSFKDIVALRTAKRLRDAGISLQGLRKVIATLQTVHNLEHPLAETYLVTDGYDVYQVVEGGETLLSLLRQPGQGAFSIVIDLSEVVRELHEAIEKAKIPAAS